MNNITRPNRFNRKNVVSSVLADVATADAISSAYYANRLLDFRKRITSPRQNLRIPNVASEPSDANVDVAWDLIRKIEQVEKTRLQDLNEQQVRKYIVALSKVVGQRTRTEYKISGQLKQELVKKAMSRVATLAPSFDYIPGEVNKQGKSKGNLVKLRGQAAGLGEGKPKKPHLTARIKTGYDI
jgi:hypothetical protein